MSAKTWCADTWSGAGVSPEDCTSFELIAHGPIFDEAQDWQAHTERRDVVATLERALADGLKLSGYVVLNEVRDRHDLDVRRWATVREAFAAHFQNLRPDLRRVAQRQKAQPGTKSSSGITY